MILHVFHKRQNGMALNQQPIINKTKSHPSQNPIHKPPRAYKILSMSGKGKWTNETFEETMDAIKGGNNRLRRASRLWNIPLNSLSNHLNGKTWMKKVGVEGILIVKENVVVVCWILVNMQQLKLKVVEINQSIPTSFQNGIPWDSWWYWFK